MVRFVVLLSYTPQGVSKIAETIARAERFDAAAKKAGVTVKSQYWTSGAHDGVMVLEASGARQAPAAEHPEEQAAREAGRHGVVLLLLRGVLVHQAAGGHSHRRLPVVRDAPPLLPPFQLRAGRGELGSPRLCPPDVPR